MSKKKNFKKKRAEEEEEEKRFYGPDRLKVCVLGDIFVEILLKLSKTRLLSTE